uniref:Putative YopX protein n=1 Tax=viral metagenome TaxID=1070528 RepID=A0A6M3JKJ3_9ZZZZ
MRDIRFRAWDEGRMVECEITMDGYVHIWEDGRVEPKMIGAVQDGRILKQVPVMQYTGLRDKNGKEIYEGDIVEGLAQQRGIVQWIPNCMRFQVSTGSIFGIALTASIERTTVIGNIYENPELTEALEK